MNVEILFDDILRQDVDVIVNPANSEMDHRGGLAGIIADAAGSSLIKNSATQAPVAPGDAILTTAGELRFKAVIHAVGPLWDDGDSNEDFVLAQAYENAMRLAHDNEFSSIAFPAISCGIYRFPVERAAPIAIQAVRRAASPRIEEVRFCLLDDDHYDAFLTAEEQD